jgi:hypothetical protein
MTSTTQPVAVATESRTRPAAGRVLRRFAELQIPMALGALVCFLLARVIPAPLAAAIGYYPGSWPFAIGDVLYLSLPVAAWLTLRGRGRRRGLETAAAMIAPVAAIVVLGELAGGPYLVWLLTAGYPAMSLGLLAVLLIRRNP